MENYAQARFHRRIVALVVVLAIFAAVVFVRYAALAFEGPDSTAVAENTPVERGRILDRNGKVLAFDIPKFNIAIRKNEIDPYRITEDLGLVARALNVNAATLEQKIRESSQNFVYLAKRLDVDKVKPLQEKQDKGQLAGFVLEEVNGRIYPEGRLASHLLGFTGEGNRGLEGIEYKYNTALAGTDGDKARGNDVYLTIDARLQYALEQISRKAMSDNKAESLFMMAMDVNSGEVLAYVQMPDFDPNNFGNFKESEREDRLSVYSYEPGSVFKIFSMASILDAGLITPKTMFNCDGAYRKILPSGEQIVIKDLHPYGMLDLAGILAKSSNAGAGYASDRMSESEFYSHILNFGFSEKTGIGSPGENPGSLREPAKWSARTKPTVAIGQEIRVTALQMITAASAMANGGILLKPDTVMRIEDADGKALYSHETVAVRRVISPETSRAILTAMESAASLEGTGWRAKVSDVRMAVKTGTAQMIDSKTRAYSDTDYIASTLGILPADNPKIAVYVAIVKPKGESYLGGQIAAPILRDAAESAIDILGLPRGKSQNTSHGGLVTIQEPAPAVVGTKMPDLTGFSKRQLLPLLLRSDLEVRLTGDGYVVAQSPPVGTAVEAGTRIVLRLQ
jgi:cell division protein FtsI (penicillin-binding protein 3)